MSGPVAVGAIMRDDPMLARLLKVNTAEPPRCLPCGVPQGDIPLRLLADGTFRCPMHDPDPSRWDGFVNAVRYDAMADAG